MSYLMREAMIDQDGAVWEKIGGAWSLYKPAQSVPVVGEPVADAAKSIASMVVEWVQIGIKNGGNWQETLPSLIERRLQRYWPTHSIPAAELERLRKDAEKRDEREDRQWRAGFNAGWNAGVTGDENALAAANSRLDSAMQERQP